MEKAYADVIRKIDQDPALKERASLALGSEAAASAVHAANTKEIAASLAALKCNIKYAEGRTTYQAALAIIAGTGDNSSGPGSQFVNLNSSAKSLGVTRNSLHEAQE